VTGSVIAVVLLMLGSGVAALFAMFVFPFAADACGDSDAHFICTGTGQQLVAVGPMWAAVAGTVVAGCSRALRPPYRGLGIALGYAIALAGFLTAWIIAAQA